jgi:hypothetical protein
MARRYGYLDAPLSSMCDLGIADMALIEQAALQRQAQKQARGLLDRLKSKVAAVEAKKKAAMASNTKPNKPQPKKPKLKKLSNF